MWHADLFCTCKVCGTQKLMDGKTLSQAKATARKHGWLISYSLALCPDCRPDKAKYD